MKSRRGCHCIAIAVTVMVLGSNCAAAAGPHRVMAPGEGDYTTYCAPCHGLRGNGDGPLAALLVPHPVRHSDARLMNALSDDYLFRLLKEGGPALGKSRLMGAWGRHPVRFPDPRCDPFHARPCSTAPLNRLLQ